MTNNVNYNAYQFVQSETAQKLKNSKGSEKSRLHLLNYEGLEGKDRYAVAAERITFKDGEEKKLGLWDRQFNVLHEHIDQNGTSTWYKINKNSLQKRLGIHLEKLGVDDKGVVGNKLEEWVTAQQKNIDELTVLAAPKNDFERRLVRGLAEAGITKDSFDKISLFPITMKNWGKIPKDELAEIKTMDPYTLLFIPYFEEIMGGSTEADKLFRRSDSPGIQLRIEHSTYKKINSGERIPQKVLDQINQPLGLPKGYVTWGNEKVEFDSKTGFLDILKIFRDFKADGTVDGNIIVEREVGSTVLFLDKEKPRSVFIEKFLLLL